MSKAANQSPVEIDGSIDFSGGVNSILVPTIQSAQNPNGLPRNSLAWLDNFTVRDGGITIRNGWNILGTVHDGSALYQGGFLYEPKDGSAPYLVLQIGGRLYIVNVDFTGPVIDLSASFGLTNPPTEEIAYFCQAEQFLIIQAGDGGTLPLFWDGAILRRSKGITNPAVAPGTPGVNEIPAGFSMDYYQGRLWWAYGRNINAGDIVKGPSGTLVYKFLDSVLNVTENPMVLGGDGFTIPSQAGNIRALKHSANIDATLGEGQLFAFTRKQVYSLTVPITRTSWIAAGNNNQPLIKVVQIVNGSVNDRSVVSVNGDLFYQSLEPSIRSLITAIRYFQQWGNTGLSANEQRLLQFNDRALMHAATGIQYDNRLLQGVLPKRVPQGIVHQAIVPLDFVPLSSFGPNLAPVWEGMYEGLDVLQMFSGDFGGRERAFMLVVSRVDSSMQLYEFTDAGRFNVNLNGEARTSGYIEFPAYTWGKEFSLKKLVSGELWVDRIFGEVVFNMEYRQDGNACWNNWLEFKVCSSKNSCEDVSNPVCYPIQPYGEGYRQTITLPEPPVGCAPQMARPTNIGYQFQVKLTVTGFCRIRGLLLHAVPYPEKLYHGLVC